VRVPNIVDSDALYLCLLCTTIHFVMKIMLGDSKDAVGRLDFALLGMTII
jgi:hypothetical protein